MVVLAFEISVVVSSTRSPIAVDFHDAYYVAGSRLLHGGDPYAWTHGQITAGIAFVYPADGLPAGPETYGVVANAPHPQAARLFMDWFLGVPGQIAAGRGLFLNSARADVPPPPGGVDISELKLLFPSDWGAFLASRTQFSRFWDKMMGMR